MAARYLMEISIYPDWGILRLIPTITREKYCPQRIHYSFMFFEAVSRQNGYGGIRSITKLPPVTDFGWQKTDNGLRIIWHDYNSSVKTSKLLAIVTKTCQCQLSQLSPMNEQKCTDCVCSRSNMKCIEQCKCERSCQNI